MPVPYRSGVMLGKDFIHCLPCCHPYCHVCSHLDFRMPVKCIHSHNRHYGWNADLFVLRSFQIFLSGSLDGINESCTEWEILSTAYARHQNPQDDSLTTNGTIRKQTRKCSTLGKFKQMVAVALILPSGLFCRATSTAFASCISHCTTWWYWKLKDRLPERFYFEHG